MSLGPFLEKLGLTSETLSSFRFGQGVLGKTAPIFLAAMVALGFIGWGLSDPWLKFITAIGIMILAGYYLHRILAFADRHPELTILEGATYVAYKQQEMAAKGLVKPPNEPMIANPTPSTESFVAAQAEEP